jgi:type VI protein secretion system component VasK
MSKITTVPTADQVAVDDLSAQLELLRWVEDQLDGLKRFRADVQRAVKLRLGDVEVGTVNGVPVVTYRKALRITLSPRLVRELDPDLARRCEEISEVRTFLLLDAA